MSVFVCACVGERENARDEMPLSARERERERKRVHKRERMMCERTMS